MAEADPSGVTALAEAGLRCRACGGNAVPTDTRLLRRSEPPLDAAIYHRRRGRPPKHLTDQEQEDETA